MHEIVCKKCGYHWFTKSARKRISCSKCKTSITLMPTRNANKPKPGPTYSIPINIPPVAIARKHEEALMPIPLAKQLNKFMLARLIGMAAANDDKSIRFKINNQNELYLLQ